MPFISVLNYSVLAPEVCPVCQYAIEPRLLAGHATAIGGHTRLVDGVFVCPRAACNRLFVAHFVPDTTRSPDAVGYWVLGECFPRTVSQKSFGPEVTKTSPRFPEIYNQAHNAEEVKLDLICGAGYRKALEFLVKDYAKSKHEKDAAEIEKKLLGACIQEYIDHPTVKAIASRATWLGNDETHYIRRWEDKDLNDLKKLIDLTAHWITLDILSAEVIKDMPDPKTAKADGK